MARQLAADKRSGGTVAPSRACHHSRGTIRRASSSVARSSSSASCVMTTIRFASSSPAIWPSICTAGLLSRAALAAMVLGRIGVVQQADQPADIAGELDVTIDDLGVDVGVEHHGRPSAEHVVSVGREQGDLFVQPATKSVVGDRLADGGREARRVADGATVGVDRFGPSGLGGEQAHLCEHSRPDQAGVADELEHHELSEDAPSFASPPLEHLVDDGDREHHDDHARGEAGQQRVPGPEASFHEIGHDPADQRQERDDGQQPRAAKERIDRLRTSRPDLVAPHVEVSLRRGAISLPRRVGPDMVSIETRTSGRPRGQTRRRPRACQSDHRGWRRMTGSGRSVRRRYPSKLGKARAKSAEFELPCLARHV